MVSAGDLQRVRGRGGERQKLAVSEEWSAWLKAVGVEQKQQEQSEEQDEEEKKDRAGH